jgi:hypothetical protein
LAAAGAVLCGLCLLAGAARAADSAETNKQPDITKLSVAEINQVQPPPFGALRLTRFAHPHFPALRSGHRLWQRPSPGKQFPAINYTFL